MNTDSDHLSISEMRHHLDTEVVGRHIYLHGTVDSTNAVLRRLADHGAEEGTVVLAESQTAGRGRPGVRWFSPDGVNLYVSVLFRPSLAPRDVARFAPIASLALSEAIEAEGLTVEIKWPNDLVVNGRKLGGTLVDFATVADRVSYVILGLGVNLNVTHADLEAALGAEAVLATSVSELAGREIDRNRFAARLLNRLEKWHQIVVAYGLEAALAAWQARDALRGRPLEVRSGGEAWRGCGRGVDADGCLLVEDAAGRPHRVVSGAIRLVDCATSDRREAP
ncbi:MAG TPA: biotin--[acetyl-CoA-carboxylase] ligase [Methylomirabilota bacterium]|jgi:BirA family biotin operon repressor/biotin-[acetyl-CoA-carboxylase] ligase